MKLYKWQRDALAKFKDADVIMADVAMGLGKTLFAALLALHKKLPVIIIAPGRLCEQWEKELLEQGVDGKDIRLFKQAEYSKDKEGYMKGLYEWLRN